MKIYVLNSDVEFVKRERDNRGKTVSVFMGNETSEILNFRCIYCGRICFQYSGEVDAIYLGAKIIDKPILDILCHQCRIRYRVY